jgi:hypothetical protein
MRYPRVKSMPLAPGRDDFPFEGETVALVRERGLGGNPQAKALYSRDALDRLPRFIRNCFGGLAGIVLHAIVVRPSRAVVVRLGAEEADLEMP